MPAEDAALWQYAAQSIEPVPKLKPRVPDMGATDVSAAPPTERWQHEPDFGEPRPVSPPAAAPVGSTPAAKPAGTAARPARAVTAPPPLAEFDRRKVRKIASGKVDIEARIDLHGLRQVEAHHQLRGFLHACVGRGIATVLVITGKGGREPEDGAARDWMSDRPDRGVLRRLVPLWLAEPDLRALVISFHGAGPRHGGDGALYVQLRRRTAGRGPDER